MPSCNFEPVYSICPDRNPMIEEFASNSKQATGFKLSGKLHDSDYRIVVPKVDEATAVGRNRLLAWFHDFHS